MARESRRKRDERRFGRPERLADYVLNTPPERWQFNPAMDRDVVLPCVAELQAAVARATHIVADNASRYFFENPKVDYVWKEDFPNVAPPFDLFLVEMVKPRAVVFGKRVEVASVSCPELFGFLFHAQDARDRSIPVGLETGRRASGITTAINPDARWFVTATPIFVDKDRPAFISTVLYFAVSASGAMLHHPSTIQTGLTLPEHILKAFADEICTILLPSAFTICLMNCKNTSVEPVARDPDVNRERQKAGLKPFLRYHTISIEPLKSDSAVAGSMNPAGVRRALHIARGHFATYTAARPLFGKYAGTFWVPSHVRGTAKQGVVISDYRVNAPAAAPIALQPPAPPTPEAAHP